MGQCSEHNGHQPLLDKVSTGSGGFQARQVPRGLQRPWYQNASTRSTTITGENMRKDSERHERPREQGESDPLQEPLKPFALAKDLFLQASPGKGVTDGSDGSAKRRYSKY